MKGYIAVTDRDWFFNIEKSNYDIINFWRKDTSFFKALKKGDPFFFLVKNVKKRSGERAILGFAVFDKYELLSVEEAWNLYGCHNGSDNKNSFIKKIDILFDFKNYDGQIGCIILKKIELFQRPVYLSQIKINFSDRIQRGKSISEIDVYNIINYGLYTPKEGFIENEDDDDEVFFEGNLKYKQHLTRERNPKVIKKAKDKFLKKHGKLNCEICLFDFKNFYGEIGEGYIEGHHVKPLFMLEDSEETKIEDIILVCSNCHRMLHRKKLFISVEYLKSLLKNRST